MREICHRCVFRGLIAVSIYITLGAVVWRFSPHLSIRQTERHTPPTEYILLVILPSVWDPVVRKVLSSPDHLGNGEP